MASFQVPAGAIAVHDKTLVANVADTVTFADDCSQIEVTSDGAAALYFTTDGTTATVGGSHCYELPAGAASSLTVEALRPSGSVVSLISTGTPKYSVTRAQ